MSQRLRDRLGRPLPPGSSDSAPAIPTGITDGHEALGLAESLLADGLPFHAHEVFEEQWRRTVGSERTLWRGLAQYAAGITHAARGNALGAGRLQERAAATLATVAQWPASFPLDRDRLAAWLEQYRPTSVSQAPKVNSTHGD